MGRLGNENENENDFLLCTEWKGCFGIVDCEITAYISRDCKAEFVSSGMGGQLISKTDITGSTRWFDF